MATLDPRLTRFDCIALAEFNKALTLNLPEPDMKALVEMLELDSRIRQKAREICP
jgi:hypothetical protein